MTKAKGSKLARQERLKTIINSDRHIYIDIYNISEELKNAIEHLYKKRKRIKISYSDEYKDIVDINKNYVLITDDSAAFKRFNMNGGKAIFLGKYKYESGCCFLEMSFGEDQLYYEKKLRSFIH